MQDQRVPHHRLCFQLLFFSIVSAPFLLCRFSRCFFVRSADADPAGPSCFSCSGAKSSGGDKGGDKSGDKGGDESADKSADKDGDTGGESSKRACCCAPRRGGGRGGGGAREGGERTKPGLVATVVAVAGEPPLAIPSTAEAPPADAPPDKKAA
jgi:hypothetical protein